MVYTIGIHLYKVHKQEKVIHVLQIKTVMRFSEGVWGVLNNLEKSQRRFLVYYYSSISWSGHWLQEVCSLCKNLPSYKFRFDLLNFLQCFTSIRYLLFHFIKTFKVMGKNERKKKRGGDGVERERDKKKEKGIKRGKKEKERGREEKGREMKGGRKERKRFPNLQEHYPHSSVGKESACNAGDSSLITGSGRSPGEGKGYPLQYSGLENSMDCIIHGVAKSQTRLSDFRLTSLQKHNSFGTVWTINLPKC